MFKLSDFYWSDALSFENLQKLAQHAFAHKMETDKNVSLLQERGVLPLLLNKGGNSIEIGGINIPEYAPC